MMRDMVESIGAHDRIKMRDNGPRKTCLASRRRHLVSPCSHPYQAAGFCDTHPIEPRCGTLCLKQMIFDHVSIISRFCCDGSVDPFNPFQCFLHFLCVFWPAEDMHIGSSIDAEIAL